MDNLSKKGFWDILYKKYPNDMQHFCNWIDQYKNNVNWKSLFPIASRNHYWVDMKFHHLPIAMQIGIFLQYVSELDSEYKVGIRLMKNKDDFDWMPRIIQDFFEYQDKN